MYKDFLVRLSTFASCGFLYQILALFLLLPVLPVVGQNPENHCELTRRTFIETTGFCIDSEKPIVNKFLRYGNWQNGESSLLLIASKNESFYVISIVKYNYSQELPPLEKILLMWLDPERNLIEFEIGNLTIADTYRDDISQALDLLDNWQPPSF